VGTDARDDRDVYMIYIIVFLAFTHHPHMATALLAVYFVWKSLWT